ncbi:cucumber peeling cupredoxin-like [Dorcoceras hygrometricum]|uniref:Cucumber peeling cupredoxin-like n=1 Tax=Dorcoceras hygrometricum TaxID=472368 RepID=A0A2Z7ALJ3_9LAMI|nr:cucumber peeling cupredoxin-like [Dorcoceras hygrometricum]
MVFHRTAVFAVLLAAELVGYAAAATYVVGDSLGWSIPPDGGAAYVNYASQHVFTAGDVLVFNFTTGEHNVARVTKSAYDVCSSTSPISLATVGPARVVLTTAGADYYICTFGQHCALGQKLAINVTAPTTSPSPAPAPAPPPTPPSITPSPSSSPSPEPGGRVTPPAPAPAPTTPAGIPPGSSPSPLYTPPPTSELTPPPPASSAPIRTSYAAVFASMIICLLMM